jgi:hypothetical protein
MMTIREPTVADADALGEIHVEAWQATYRGWAHARQLSRCAIDRGARPDVA